ncbi:MAG: hypothetical protein JO290_08135 [Sphingomonadaceae bacterium]|nr:hypothetical protein [Sphingomonadaceae bacterium]
MRWAAIGAAIVAAAAAAAPPGPVYQGGAGDFVAAHGERALVAGYADGLEVWAYPLQLLRGLRPRFHVAGAVAAIDGATLLARIEHRPAETVRVYVGRDFVVREHLFVPRSEAAAIIRYEVDGRPDVGIEVRFDPALDLMWPGALGGQTIGWDDAAGGYVERDGLGRFAATIASPETVAHDDVVNRTRPLSPGVALRLAPRGAAGAVRTASLFVVGRAATKADIAALAARAPALQREGEARAAAVLGSSLAIVTPDAEVDAALASAVLALDQAWVCSDELGCGIVAGYGPSRPGRRPQYAWFFAGDGLVATEALLASGQFGRARDELAFVARHQDRRTGMIWHELSQSAPLIDWTRYPYMFVHVDISLQYLATVADYVRISGDDDFARASWPGLAAAWRYCTTLIDAAGLPRIPPGKAGQNEQDALRDDIRLSTLWIDAADGFATLARAAGHERAATQAGVAAARARRALSASGWDASQGFWLSGHTAAGEAVHDARSDAAGVLRQGVFTPEQVEQALDRLTGPAFVTDWGIRSLSAGAGGYDPNRYGSGSVWALGTGQVAAALWQAHRPLAALGLWRGLVAWNTLDSRGHLHELLAGDLFHPEVESVPEQTWSSASLLTATAALLGLDVRSGERAVGFAPHLPPSWPGVTLRGVAVGPARLTLTMRQGSDGVDLDIDNPGPAVAVDFAPQVAMGARIGAATLDGAPVAVAAEPHAQDLHLRTRFAAPTGASHLHVAVSGGVTVEASTAAPLIGAPSRGLAIGRATLAGGTLTLTGTPLSAAPVALIVASPWALRRVAGGDVAALGGGRYRLCLAGSVPFAATLDFDPAATTAVVPGRGCDG